MTGQHGPFADIRAIRGHLPERVVTNEELGPELGWSPADILRKTGIAERHIAAPDETAADLGHAAASRLLDECGIDAASVQFLIVCTQTPDHPLPATACLLQQRLGLRDRCAAFDINQGCSGYVYALAIAAGFIRGGLYQRGMVVTADTYSKLIHPRDRSVRTLFGDGATASWVTASDGPGLGRFALGTEGRGAYNLIVPAGGFRRPRSEETAEATADSSGNWRSPENLYMNGPAIFEFTLRRVPGVVQQALDANGLAADDVDWYVFHQANAYMLEHLREKMQIPRERLYLHVEAVGNTVSSTIPLALEDGVRAGRIVAGQRLLLAGFGVGYSWGAVTLTWTGGG